MSAALSPSRQLRLMLDMALAERNLLRAEVDSLRAQQPIAWGVFSSEGDCIMWSRDVERAEWSSARVLRPVTALYAEARPQGACTWLLDDEQDLGAWQSSCGQAWMFTEGGPAENGVRYCQGCGKPVRIEQAKQGDQA